MSTTESQGGALVNLIHSYTDNGDPFIRKFTDQLLEEVCMYLQTVFATHSSSVRFPNLFSLHYTNGYSLASFMTRSTSFLLQWIQA